MDRRLMLKYLGMASAAAMVLPSCVGDVKKLSIALNNLQITAEEEELLASLATTLIPATDTPGAREVEAHLFTFVMVDDCLSKEDQQKFLTGMRSFDKEVKALTGASFVKASVEEKTSILARVDLEKENLSEEVKTFYQFSRGYIIQGYQSSKHFLTQVKPYKHIPGPVFNGCKPLLTDTKNIS